MAHTNNHTRRDEIRSAAERLFREKGYLATSMRDLADEMDMKGGGSLYAHIRGKEDLLWEIANEATDAFFSALEPILSQELPPVQKLRAAMIAHLTTIMDHLGAAAVFFDEWRHLSDTRPDNRRTQYLTRRDAYERVFQELICAGIASGTFRPVDERLATLHILGGMNAIRHWYRPDGRLTSQQVAEGIADMLLHGLR
jgi:TetR/AcrR family transcriptional regulator, cholesterol catabolism regulator